MHFALDVSNLLTLVCWRRTCSRVRLDRNVVRKGKAEMKQCLLCKQKKERLARAHIFALGFFSGLPTKARGNTISLSNGTGRKLQSALYDSTILCDVCEHGIMQPLDDYAIQIIRDRKGMFRVPLPAEAPMGLLIFDGVDKRKIRAFLASVLWRCSVSKQPEISALSVGSVYEHRIGQDLLHDGDFAYIDMVLFYLTHPLHGAFVLPTRKRLRPLDTNRDWQMINGWNLQFPNISLTVSLDKRPNPHRVFLSLASDLTGRPEALLVSTCLKADSQEYSLLALEAETQDNHMEHILTAIRRKGLESHNKPI